MEKATKARTAGVRRICASNHRPRRKPGANVHQAALVNYPNPQKEHQDAMARCMIGKKVLTCNVRRCHAGRPCVTGARTAGKARFQGDLPESLTASTLGEDDFLNH